MVHDLSVIPGRAEGASPESITTAAEYGYRARRFALRLSLEILAFFGQFHTLFHTFSLTLHGPACPDFSGLTSPPAMVVSGHPDNAATDFQMARSTFDGTA